MLVFAFIKFAGNLPINIKITENKNIIQEDLVRTKRTHFIIELIVFATERILHLYILVFYTLKSYTAAVLHYKDSH